MRRGLTLWLLQVLRLFVLGENCFLENFRHCRCFDHAISLIHEIVID